MKADLDKGQIPADYARMRSMHQLSREESLSFVAFVEACQTVTSKEVFLSSVQPKLNEILPHKMFTCDIHDAGSELPQLHANLSYPHEKFCQVTAEGNCMVKLMIGKWMESMQPMFYNMQLIDCEDKNQVWMKDLFSHVAENIACHGVLEHTGEIHSFFVFGGLDTWTLRENFLLRLLVPHLHVAVMRIFRVALVRGQTQLTLREREVLNYICMGKSNGDIAALMGISHWTVKIHVRNLMAKLDVKSRSQAVAKAYKLRILGLQ
jgi:transcriptional regulator EpsA